MHSLVGGVPVTLHIFLSHFFIVSFLSLSSFLSLNINKILVKYLIGIITVNKGKVKI